MIHTITHFHYHKAVGMFLVRLAAGQATAAAIPFAKLQIMPQMGHNLPRALWPRLIESIAGHAKTH